MTFNQLILPSVDDKGLPTSDIGWTTLRTDTGWRSVYGYMGCCFQKEFLYNLGFHTKGHALEIGSFQGLSAVLIGLGMKHGFKGHLTCVDPWEDFAGHVNTFESFQSNIEGFDLQRWVTPERFRSQDYEPFKSLEWVYIDGDHTTGGTLLDCSIYIPKVKPNGLVIFHDSDQPAVRTAIREAVATYELVHLTGGIDWEVYLK